MAAELSSTTGIRIHKENKASLQTAGVSDGARSDGHATIAPFVNIDTVSFHISDLSTASHPTSTNVPTPAAIGPPIPPPGRHQDEADFLARFRDPNDTPVSTNTDDKRITIKPSKVSSFSDKVNEN